MEKTKVETIRSQNKIVLDNLKKISDMIDGNKEIVMDSRGLVDKSEYWDVWLGLNMANTALLRASREVDDAIKWIERSE